MEHTCTTPRPELESVRLREARHRYGNTLQVLSGLVRAKARKTDNEEVREFTLYVHELVEALWSLEKYAGGACQKISLTDRLNGMCRQWQRLCNGHITVDLSAEPGVTLPQGDQTLVCLIAHELVINAVKHAFPEERDGVIRIRCMQLNHGYGRLIVEDDGVGRGARAARLGDGSQGTALIHALTSALGGKIERGEGEDGRGHRVKVSWPL